MKRRILTFVLCVMLLTSPAWANYLGDLLRAGIDAYSNNITVLNPKNLKVGNGTPSVTQNGEDMYVEGTFEVDGAARFDGTTALNGTTTVTGDLTVPDEAGGGNDWSSNSIRGKLRLSIANVGAGTNGAAAGKTVALMDDTPAGEFAATDGDTTCTNNTTYLKNGTNSLKMAVAITADAGDGCHDGVTLDFTGDEFIGFWVRSSRALVAGDVVLDLTDDGGARVINVPALAAGVWTWVNLSLPAADGDKDVITDISLELSDAGAVKAATGAFDVYTDLMYKWDDTEEEALGSAICLDCIYAVTAVATAAGSANTTSGLVIYTDYFVKYTDSNESLVWITDQSANSAFVLLGLDTN